MDLRKLGKRWMEEAKWFFLLFSGPFSPEAVYAYEGAKPNGSSVHMRTSSGHTERASLPYAYEDA